MEARRTLNLRDSSKRRRRPDSLREEGAVQCRGDKTCRRGDFRAVSVLSVLSVELAGAGGNFARLHTRVWPQQDIARGMSLAPSRMGVYV
jgi:hypothetical protein